VERPLHQGDVLVERPLHQGDVLVERPLHQGNVLFSGPGHRLLSLASAMTEDPESLLPAVFRVLPVTEGRAGV